MPQIFLETTANLEENAEIPDILHALANTLSQFETVDPSAVKAFHGLRMTWAMGEGAPAGFVQCQVSVLTGRSLELRGRIADAIMKVLQEAFSVSVEEREASITLEIREMERETFRKAVKPLT